MVNPTITVNGAIVSVSWNTVPLATNFVFWSTNLSDYKSFTNIASEFITPEPYPGSVVECHDQLSEGDATAVLLAGGVPVADMAVLIELDPRNKRKHF